MSDPTITTEAIVQRKVGQPASLEVVKVGSLQPDEALIEMHASGVCHTDISSLAGRIPGAERPAIFGHEGAGIVLDIGSNVTSVSKGDKVLLSFQHCENCVNCTTGHPAYCMEFVPRNFGSRRLDGSTGFTVEKGDDPVYGHYFGQSSFAKTSIVHKSSLVKVPPDTPLDRYAPLGCGMITGAGTVLNTLNLKAGDEIVIFGCGGVGMSAIMAAKLREAKKIIAVDLFAERLELAKDLGATHTINGADEDIVEQIQKLCPPVGIQYAIDASGVPSVVEKMIQSLAIRGKAVSLGSPAPGVTAQVDIASTIIMGREYVGATEGDSIPSKMIPYLIEQNKQGKFPVERLITYYEAKDFQKAFDDMHHGKALKAVLRWR